jgi:hypothetical protein
MKRAALATCIECTVLCGQARRELAHKSSGVLPCQPLSCAFSSILFEHLVGKPQQRRRDREAQCLCRPEIDDHFEPGRLHDRQIRGLFAPENTANIQCCLPPCISLVRTIADQTADAGLVATIIDRRNLVAQRQLGQMIGNHAEERIGANNKRVHI